MEYPDEYGPPTEADELWWVQTVVAQDYQAPVAQKGPVQFEGQLSIEDEIGRRRGV